METIDEEITKASLDYLERAKKANKPFFLWWNSTRMHIWTHLKKESQGKTGLGVYPDGMVEHDAMVGQLLDKLKELGLDENTIVMYSTDNGAESFSWPDGGTTPFRNEKATQLGRRVPRAPAPFAGRASSSPVPSATTIFAHEDMIPTLMAAAGVPDVQGAASQGHEGRQRAPSRSTWTATTSPMRSPARRPDPRKEFFYFNDDGSLVALRYNQWKIVFAEQRAHGFDVWQEPFTPLRLPKLFNLRSDPFELADHDAIGYPKWRIDRVFLLVPAQQYVGRLPRLVQGVPAEPEGRQLLPRRRREGAPAESVVILAPLSPKGGSGAFRRTAGPRRSTAWLQASFSRARRALTGA